VITAVNGMVNGGGLHFIADSDLILAAEHATFFDTHVKIGLLSALEPVGLARRIPLEAVLRMSLLGGSRAHDRGRGEADRLVGEVVPLADLLPRARELAAKIAHHSPTALAGTKRAIWESIDRGLHDGLRPRVGPRRRARRVPDPLEGRARVRREAQAALGAVLGMTYETIEYAVDDASATITLNRPEKRNAYVPQMGEDIVAGVPRPRATTRRCAR
jgi:enoyl-CoA hydratase/carnithine racemase